MHPQMDNEYNDAETATRNLVDAGGENAKSSKMPLIGWKQGVMTNAIRGGSAIYGSKPCKKRICQNHASTEEKQSLLEQTSDQ
ncbi:unnamed protein product [Anisakis simplex]|uniref:Reverse transcriptase domain-containing protein n=1 Tax=Anisakis simplex TaxID=6269 RepID=A0A0M3K4Y8_ANISI|nr:unnamed protein product [Anisakis simplex]